MSADYHFGRSWEGTSIEDECPCFKANCGLVAEASEDCEQHSPAACKTMRQGHAAEDCGRR